MDVGYCAFDVQEKQMGNDLTADGVRALLKLEPHPTCGFVRDSQEQIAPGGLPPPFAEGRPAGSALYFMVTPSAPVRLHRIRNDQLYHYYLGDPIEVLMLHGDGTTPARCGRGRICASTHAAPDPREHFSYRARDRATTLIPRCEH